MNKALQKILEENPEFVLQAMKMTARQLGIPESKVMEYLSSSVQAELLTKIRRSANE